MTGRNPPSAAGTPAPGGCEHDSSLARFGGPRYWPTWLLLGCLKITSQLPYRVQIAIGRGLGAALHALSRKRRRIAAINVETCFPELIADEREQLVRRHFEAIGISFIEMGIGWFSPLDKLRELVHVDGVEHLERARKDGRAVLLVSAHLTPLEAAFAIFTDISPGIGCMYRPQRNAMMDALIRRGRGRYVDEQIPRDNVRALIKALKRGKIVVYLPDQTYLGNQSTLLPFFGEPALTNVALTKLAQIGDAVVLTCLFRRLSGGGGYRVEILPLDEVPSDDPLRDTRRWLDVLEAHIRKAPEQYLWVYKKFKHRPAPLPDPYAGL